MVAVGTELRRRAALHDPGRDDLGDVGRLASRDVIEGIVTVAVSCRARETIDGHLALGDHASPGRSGGSCSRASRRRRRRPRWPHVRRPVVVGECASGGDRRGRDDREQGDDDGECDAQVAGP